MRKNNYLMNNFIKIIDKKNPLQKKAIKAFVEGCDDLFWQRSDDYCKNMFQLLQKEQISLDYVADSYLKMCKDMLKEQIKFKRTGKYSCSTVVEAVETVYHSEEEMSAYMYGLGLSQFLWPNHYFMYSYFIDVISKLNDVKTYLEIGPGHGLFLVESLKRFKSADFTAVDISPVSVSITQKVVKEFSPQTKCRFINCDVREFVEDYKYDVIVMCEVLEHLEDPNEILQKVKALLNPGGTAFITTCANAPAIDHVYLYTSADHIRKEICAQGFNIVSDLTLPVENEPEEQWERKKVELNYAAVLETS